MSIKMSFDTTGLLNGLVQVFKVSFWKRALKGSVEGLVIYLAYFIISEIMISGGRYEQDIYLEIVSLIIVISVTLYFIVRRKDLDQVKAINEGFGNLMVFAILDFLMKNLLLDANSGQIYKYWGTLVIYAVVLITPYVVFQIKKRRPVAEPVEIS